MVLKRRFEVITPLPANTVAESLSNVSLHMAWINHIMDLPKVQDRYNGEGVLLVSGGKYPVKITLTPKTVDGSFQITLRFSGTFSMKIIYTIKKEVIGTKVRGDIEISVGFLWERMLKGFIKDLSEHLRSQVFNYLKELEASPPKKEEEAPKPTQEAEQVKETGGEEGVAERPKEELQKKIRSIKTSGDLTKLNDPIFLSKLIASAELVDSVEVSSTAEYIDTLIKHSGKHKEGTLYTVLKNEVIVRALFEGGVMTGFRIEAGEEVFDGAPALHKLTVMPDLKGKLYVFRQGGEKGK